MLKLYKPKLMLLFIFILGSFLFIGCSSSDKLFTLSPNVMDDMKVKENSILESMTSGSTALNDKNFAEAKKEFEKALSYDKSNIKTYNDIKDKYLDAKRFDDAYYFIKMAIDNGADVDNMKAILDDIKAKFETTEINESIPLNSHYALPTEVSMNINGEPSTVGVNWKNTNVSTDKLDNFVYEGFSEEYGHNIKLNLNIREILKEKKIGFITDLYEKNGKAYIKFDECQMFFDKINIGDYTASKEAIKDGSGSLDSDGLIYNGYYIRNSSTDSKEYIISKDFIYYSRTPKLSASGERISEGYESFKEYVKNNLTNPPKFERDNRLLLCWINTEDGIVVNLEMQYTP